MFIRFIIFFYVLWWCQLYPCLFWCCSDFRCCMIPIIYQLLNLSPLPIIILLDDIETAHNFGQCVFVFGHLVVHVFSKTWVEKLKCLSYFIMACETHHHHRCSGRASDFLFQKKTLFHFGQHWISLNSVSFPYQLTLMKNYFKMA